MSDDSELILTDEDIALINRNYEEMISEVHGSAVPFYPKAREGNRGRVEFMTPAESIGILLEFVEAQIGQVNLESYESKWFVPWLHDPLSTRSYTKDTANKEIIRGAAGLLKAYMESANFDLPYVYKGQLEGEFGKFKAIYTGLIDVRNYHDWRGQKREDITLFVHVSEKGDPKMTALNSYTIHDFTSVDQAKTYFRSRTIKPVGRAKWFEIGKLKKRNYDNLVYVEIE